MIRLFELIYIGKFGSSLFSGAALVNGLYSSLSRGPVFLGVLVLFASVSVPVQHLCRLSGKPSWLPLDHDGGDHAGLGPSGRVLQHRGGSRGGLEVSDRVHRWLGLRSVWNHCFLCRRRARRVEAGVAIAVDGVGKGSPDACRPPIRSLLGGIFSHRRTSNRAMAQAHPRMRTVG